MVLAEAGAAGYWWVPVLTTGLTVIGALLEWARRTVRADRQQAEGARDQAQTAHRDTQEEGRAFIAVIVDLQKRIETCTSEATAAREEAQRVARGEEECKNEVQRLRGVVEGILSDRRRDAQP